MIHWLSVNVWPTSLHTIVAAIVGAFFATMFMQPMRGAMRLLRGRLSLVLDSLDPDIPVGLTKQLDDMRDELRKMNDFVNVVPVSDSAQNPVSHGHVPLGPNRH